MASATEDGSADVVIFGFRADEDLSHCGTLTRMEKGDKIWMKMFKTTSFRHAFAEFCKRNALDEKTLCFFLGNREITGSDTPAKVIMKSGSDIVSVKHKKEILKESSFYDEFKGLFKSSRLSDVTLKVKDTLFPCHRVILAARCPKFGAMFGSGGPSALRERTEEIIEITGHDAKLFELLLEYIYSDKIATLSAENALELLCLADEYLIERLKQMCELELIAIVDVDNVADLLCHANHYQAAVLKNFCISFILDNAHLVVNNPSFERDLQSAELLHEIIKATSKRLPEPASDRALPPVKKRKREAGTNSPIYPPH